MRIPLLHSVEIIGTNESTTLSAATDGAVEVVHPSNMEVVC